MKPDEMWKLLRPELEKSIERGVPIQTVAEFCKVKPLTIKTWLNDKSTHKPAGTQLLKLWYFIAAMGHRTLPNLHNSVRSQYVAELYAYSVISIQDVLEIFGLPKETSTIMKQLKGERPFPERTAKYSLDDLEELYQASLDEQKSNLAEMLQGISLVKPIHQAGHQEVSTFVVDEHAPEEPAEVEAVQTRQKLQLRETPLVEQIQPPSDRTLEVATILSGVMPSLRMVMLETNVDLMSVKRQLHLLMGHDGVAELAGIFELKPPLQDSEEVPEVQCTKLEASLVERIAALLREVAPLVEELCKDTSAEGGDAREQLRAAVGQKLYSELAVALTKMRSRQAYEKALNGEVN